MSDKNATIYDIARACGVSPATVSREVSNSGYPVSERTRQLVLQTARQLHYTPNLLGKSLKAQKSRDLGIIIPNISNSYYSLLLQGVYDEAIARGYNTILCNSYRKPEIEEKNINTLMAKQVCGILLVSIGKQTEPIRRAMEHGCQVILMEQDLNIDCVKVGFNFYKGAYMATRCLIEHHHRRIGFIGAPLDRSSRIRMVEGYRQALADHHIPEIPRDICLSETERDDTQIYEFENGRAAATYFIDMEDRPTGYVCVNDMTALGAIRTFQSAGLSVPQDVSLTGFDNIPYSEISSPRLTTIDQCTYDMGSLSTRMLVESIEEPKKPHSSITLEPTLVERDSVRTL